MNKPNKPKLNQPDVEQSTTIEPNVAYGTPESHYFYNPTSLPTPLDPTIEEVKKEWEDDGWFFTKYKDSIFEIKRIKIEQYDGKSLALIGDIQLDLEEKDCYIRSILNYHQLQLLIKTFRALGLGGTQNETSNI